MFDEVTIKEVLAKYDVFIKFTEYLAWSKTIRFVGADKVSYTGILSWDINNGYSITFTSGIPTDLLDLSMRPEFEYVLDCITEGDTGE